jgi:hypothetical protein
MCKSVLEWSNLLGVYSLCALVARTEHLEGTAVYSKARLVRLGEGLSMIPLSEELLREIQSTASGKAHSRPAGVFEFLTPPLEAWARALSRQGPVAYLETEYLGGEGYERSAVWQNSELALGPFDGAGSVNQVLQALGVRTRPGQEAFDAVGLGRHRSLEGWLSEPR